MWNVEAELEEQGYTFEFDDGYYGYSWSITKYFSKDGRLFSLLDTGCSCSHFGSYWSDVDEAIGEMYEVTSLPDPQEEELYRKLYEWGIR